MGGECLYAGVFVVDGWQMYGRCMGDVFPTHISFTKHRRVWDVQTGVCRHVLEGHTDAVQHAVCSPTANLVLTCSYDGTARLWDITTGAMLCVLPHDQAAPPTQGVVSVSGECVVTVDANGGAYLWHVVEDVDVDDDGTPQRLGDKDTTFSLSDNNNTHGLRPQLVARLGSVAGSDPAVVHATISPDGARVATCGQDGTVVVYDTTQGAAQGVFRVDAPCRSCAFAGTDEWVLVVGTDPGHVHFLEHA